METSLSTSETKATHWETEPVSAVAVYAEIEVISIAVANMTAIRMLQREFIDSCIED